MLTKPEVFLLRIEPFQVVVGVSVSYQFDKSLRLLYRLNFDLVAYVEEINCAQFDWLTRFKFWGCERVLLNKAVNTRKRGRVTSDSVHRVRV